MDLSLFLIVLSRKNIKFFLANGLFTNSLQNSSEKIQSIIIKKISTFQCTKKSNNSPTKINSFPYKNWVCGKTRTHQVLAKNTFQFQQWKTLNLNRDLFCFVHVFMNNLCFWEQWWCGWKIWVGKFRWPHIFQLIASGLNIVCIALIVFLLCSRIGFRHFSKHNFLWTFSRIKKCQTHKIRFLPIFSHKTGKLKKKTFPDEVAKTKSANPKESFFC